MTQDETPARAPVAVTGGAGYVGSVVVRKLLERGYPVRVLDNFLFGSASLDTLTSDRLEVVAGDIRRREDIDRVFAGAGAVLHLAGLVGDPACALDPAYTKEINLESSRVVAESCREHGVERLVFASTCSVYGAAGDDWLDEDSATGPVSLYAETNLLSEDLLRHSLADTGTTLSTLRFATIYGCSPRMRFDLVVNLLAARAIEHGRIEVHGGEQWRPQVHVQDVSSALILAMVKPAEIADGVFNVGSNEQNLRIGELASRIAATFPGTKVRVDEVRDPRSYRVSFDRIRDRLGFEPTFEVEQGAREVAEFLQRNGADPRDAVFHNVATLRENLSRKDP